MSFLPSPTWWRRHVNMRTLYLLLLGQLVSFFLALMSFTSSLIANLGVDAPITQTMFTYLLLALVYGGILLHRREKLRVSWYWYLLLGFVDVQGNYLVNEAYQFSSITSVTLLDCFTIAWVLLLTWIFLGARYSLWQLFGAVLCVVGLGVVLLSDAGVAGGGGSQPLLGDVLVIGGTIFFALSNVGEVGVLCEEKRSYGSSMHDWCFWISSECVSDIYSGIKESGVSRVVYRYYIGLCWLRIGRLYALHTWSVRSSDEWSDIVQSLYSHI
ncbi:hypothetical protein ACLB2K_060070 [Fragaria x ananassa]